MHEQFEEGNPAKVIFRSARERYFRGAKGDYGGAKGDFNGAKGDF